MIQMAYCESERVVTGTLESIAAEVRRTNIEPPATLVVGEVVRLRERLQQLVASHATQKEGGV
jgi:siroheme synthase